MNKWKEPLTDLGVWALVLFCTSWCLAVWLYECSYVSSFVTHRSNFSIVPIWLRTTGIVFVANTIGGYLLSAAMPSNPKRPLHFQVFRALVIFSGGGLTLLTGLFLL